MLTQHYALLSIIWMIGFVLLFDRIHRRKQHYRQLWQMYRVVAAGRAGTEYAA